MKEKVSIIIPCYNVEKVVKRCLDSVFAQKAPSVEYEVICVDDKSTDATLKILLEYENVHADHMVVIPLEENGKQGRARNIALDYASGDYVMYVDADDMIAEELLEILYSAMQEYQCDVAECAYQAFSDAPDPGKRKGGKPEIYDMSDLSWRKACILRRFPKTAPWGRLYKKKVLSKETVFFPEGITMEDTYFSELSMAYMKRYVWIPDTLYFYYINPEGTYYNPKAVSYYMDAMLVQNAATDRIREEGLLPGCDRELEYLYFLKAFCDPVARMLKSQAFFSYENYCRIYQELMQRFPQAAENAYVNQSDTELLMFSRELCRRQFSETELALALYGAHYNEVLAHADSREDVERVEDVEKVSILLVTSNQKAALCETLDSLMRQTWKNIEIIIVDEASVDGSLEAVQERYGDRNEIFYLYNEVPLGTSAAYNSGLEHAAGAFLAFAECGAKWQPDRLRRQLEQLGDTGVWNYCAVEMEGRIFPRTDWEDYKRRGMLMPVLLMEKQISLQGVLVRKQCCDVLGGFDKNLMQEQEYEFLLRLSERYYGDYVDAVLVSAPPSRIQPDHLVTADVYLLLKYERQLSECGLKREKLTQILDNAGFLGKLELLWAYVDLLLEDEGYAAALEEYIEKHNLVRCLEECEGDTIQGVRHCTGCAVCCEICPVKAIHMENDAGGFLVPVVDAAKCIHCGKCVSHCPTQIDLQGSFRQQICYAVQARDCWRDRGSSGGMFPVLADFFLTEGGFVAGAVFEADFSVKHIVSNRRDDVQRMCGSKYVQSDMRGIYPTVESLLRQGKPVLFSGCACQVAGLKAYLRWEYENLYTMDVVCHGVPSPGAWKQYMEKCSGNCFVDTVSFREKNHLGWQPGLYLKYSDGTEKTSTCALYMKAFLNNWILRDSCYHCNFKGESYSDITLGDFWGIQSLDENFDDRGTSFVTLNTSKGKLLYDRVESELELQRMFPVSAAVLQNTAIEKPMRDNRMHMLLKDTWQGGDWESALERVYGQQHFDVALVCLWSKNYGNAITNYALYRTLEKQGSVIAIDTGVTRPQEQFEHFARQHYLLSSELYSRGEWDRLQEHCDTFLVGSDQVWNAKYTEESHWGTYFQLDFVRDDRKRVSYASSFGQKGLEPSSPEAADLYRRFTHLSVREETGIGACREKYGVDARQVLDPVFLLDAGEYDALLGGMPEAEEPFITAYLLNPTMEKREICEKIRRELGDIKIVYMVDNAMETRDLYRHILKFADVKFDLRVEEWLYYLRNACYIITDSFHGTCFSMILHKQFLSFVNRQTDRFQVFEKFADVPKHIMNVPEALEEHRLYETIDYEAVDEELERERKKSLHWLEQALKG